jgi:hypothetical protein
MSTKKYNEAIELTTFKLDQGGENRRAARAIYCKIIIRKSFQGYRPQGIFVKS